MPENPKNEPANREPVVRVANELHPFVYMLMAGLIVLLVVGAWGFAGNGDADYLLVIVSGFILAVAALQVVLWRIGREHTTTTRSFREWSSGEFGTWQDRVRGRNAAIEILLPIAAVAFGMAAIAIAFHVASSGAS